MRGLRAVPSPSSTLPTFVAQPQPSPVWPIDESAGISLFVATRSELSHIDLDTQARSVAMISISPVGGIARVGTLLVLLESLGDHTEASVQPFDLRAPRVGLGQADALVPSTREGRVWLISQGSRTEGREVELGSSRVVRRAALPALFSPVADTAAGLVATRSTDGGTELWIWDTRSRRLGRRLGEGGLLGVIGAKPHVVAWTPGCSQGSCPLHLTEPATGKDVGVEPVRGTFSYLGGGAFSPDGARLAAFAPVSNQRAALVIVDVASRTARRISGSEVATGEPIGAAGWSSDGRWLFFSGLGGWMRVWRVGWDGAQLLPGIPASYSFSAS